MGWDKDSSIIKLLNYNNNNNSNGKEKERED